MSSNKKSGWSVLLNVISAVSGLATIASAIVVFIGKDAVVSAINSSAPAIGNVVQHLGDGLGGAGGLVSHLGSWVAAGVLLAVVLLLRLAAEWVGLYVTKRIRPTEIFFNALLLLPLAGVWSLAFREQVGIIGVSGFLVAYLVTILVATMVSVAISADVA